MKKGVKITLIIVGVLFLIALAFFIWWIVSLLNLTKHSIHRVFSRNENKNETLGQDIRNPRNPRNPNNQNFNKHALFFIMHHVDRENLSGFLKKIRYIVSRDQVNLKPLHADAHLATDFDLYNLQLKYQQLQEERHQEGHQERREYINELFGIPVWVETDFMDFDKTRDRIQMKQWNEQTGKFETVFFGGEGNGNGAGRAGVAIRVLYHDQKTNVQAIEKNLRENGGQIVRFMV